jgi:hypothetical protein
MSPIRRAGSSVSPARRSIPASSQYRTSAALTLRDVEDVSPARRGRKSGSTQTGNPEAPLCSVPTHFAPIGRAVVAAGVSELGLAPPVPAQSGCMANRRSCSQAPNDKRPR